MTKEELEQQLTQLEQRMHQLQADYNACLGAKQAYQQWLNSFSTSETSVIESLPAEDVQTMQ